MEKGKEHLFNTIDVDFREKINAIQVLYGIDYDALKAKYLLNKSELLKLVLSKVDSDYFTWALNANAKLDIAFEKKTEALVNNFKKPQASNTDADFIAAEKYFKANPIDVANMGAVTFAEELYNWQIKCQVSFSFKQLAQLLYTFAYNSCCKSADELLEDQYICEVINIAYVKPTLLIK